MDQDSKRIWELVLAPVSATLVAAIVLGFGSWVTWVSNGVAAYEEHDDDFSTIVEKVERIEDDTSYLRGWVENSKSRDD